MKAQQCCGARHNQCYSRIRSRFVRLLLPTICCLLSSSLAGAWQQRVAYDIKVRLDPRLSFLHGQERLWYWNNSPDTLNFVWIHLYPNAYRNRNTVFGRELEREQQYDFSFARKQDLGYIDVHNLRVDGEAVEESSESRVQSSKLQESEDTETEMMVNLPRALAPGDSVRLELGFDVKIPAYYSRMGHKGNRYVISQWYPKMAVYDQKAPEENPESEIRNSNPDLGLSASSLGFPASGQWHPDAYHAIGGFYGEFGTFDVAITVPSEMVVGATGDLVQGAGVGGQGSGCGGQESVDPDSETAWMRLSPRARPKRPDSLKTLLFHAGNVDDFCWVADPAFVLTQERVGAVVINVLTRSSDEQTWKDVPLYALQALQHYSSSYGPYPYPQLTVADAGLKTGNGMEYPEVVAVSAPTIPFSRALELVVVREIGLQWFDGMLGPNGLDEPWLDEGMNTFAEMRYFDEVYGPRGNLIDASYASLLPWDVNDRYVQQFRYHVTATNGWLKPMLTPANAFLDQPFAYSGVDRAEAGLMLDMLRKTVGDTCFDRIMQTYVERFRFHHPRSADFIAVAEEVSGRSLHWFFDQWLNTTKTCDYQVSSVAGSRVRVRRSGGIRMPVEVRARLRDGTLKTLVCPDTGGVLDFGSSVASVEIDPDEKLLEANRWDNFFPRKVEIEPFFDVPSLESYQLFYGPYAWFDLYHGFQVGPWMMGRRFVDYGPLHGEHQWMASLLYRTNLKDLATNASYSSPLAFVSDRLKLDARTDYSNEEVGAGADLTYHLGRALGLPNADLKLGYRFTELRSLQMLDSQDFALDTIGLLSLSADYSHLNRNFRGQLGTVITLASSVLGSRQDYWRMNVEATEVWRMNQTLGLQARFFGGASGGSIPFQQQFFLSGSLEPTDAAPLIWSYLGTIATQENWHIEGDADLVGYARDHVKGQYAEAINLRLRIPYISPFFDIGNVGNSFSALAPSQLRMDAGLRVALGPVYADFPVWTSPANFVDGRNFAFRWVLGLDLSRFNFGL